MSGQAWVEANSGARQRPEREGFEAARYVYTYAPGAIFELVANPNFISTILLEEGETLNTIAAGDTSRWQVSEAIAEGSLGLRTLLLVKPAAAGLRTNIVLVTDRRTYLVEAVSQAGDAYSAEIAWCYPDAEQSAHTQGGALNFDYRVRVLRGVRPAWTPLRVFDDGRRTWIEFAEATEAGELPPLFVITSEGAELVNYRINGRRYIVDRVFDRAELRLGVRAPQIVGIERVESIASHRRPRRGRP
ncbi:TrbG/VirB9 family P-type conjugative transfer protein [Vitreimonas flagellata]|uniref:TrbG/VirB9 family P-type conjugative transfer protein n=1 Tax=Vitreimonas flagellata TaxID=2560861 RepID=UPI0014311FB4|nr:TrbG/VirB9 family P-type conjugative transfer protein [Vitreimonas flagellata]